MSVYILCAILVLASVWDLRTLKIPNVLALIGISLGLVFSFIEGGLSGIGWSGLSIVLVFAIFLPAWMFFGVGAGDVKLLMVIASFLGLDQTLHIGFSAIILSAFVFLFLISPKQIVKMFRDYLYLLFYKLPILINEKTQKKLPFAVILTAVSLYYIYL